MTTRAARLDPRIKRLLEEVNLEYEVTRSSKHYQLRVGGRLVVTIPQDYSSGGYRTQVNAVCAVRRFIRTTLGL